MSKKQKHMHTLQKQQLDVALDDTTNKCRSVARNHQTLQHGTNTIVCAADYLAEQHCLNAAKRTAERRNTEML